MGTKLYYLVDVDLRITYGSCLMAEISYWRRLRNKPQIYANPSGYTCAVVGCLRIVVWNLILCSLVRTYQSGFGGLEVACWPLVPKFAGSNPAEAVGFFRAKKSSARLPSEGK